MTAVAWARARERAHAVAEPLPPADLPLGEALGTTLAGPLAARCALPPFDAAAMDGYAVRGSGPWRVVGHALAGHPPHRALDVGEAMEVATGAVVPVGTDAVLPHERAHRSAAADPTSQPSAQSAAGRAARRGVGHVGHVGYVVHGVVDLGRHVRRAGEECAAGTTLATEGTPVTPVILGLAAAAGHDVLRVRPRPRVVALITGDELVTSGTPERGRIRDAVGPQLPGLVGWLGGAVVERLWLPDDRGALRDAVRDAGADIVLTCGASSTGPADHLPAVLRELGADLVVAGVACRPGHPQALALLPGGRALAGLPGNPLAALVAVLTLVGPLIAGLGGRPLAPLRRATLLGEVRPDPYVTRLIVVRQQERQRHGRQNGEEGGPGADTVVAVGSDRPAQLSGAARGDALAVVPPCWAGGEVGILPLPQH